MSESGVGLKSHMLKRFSSKLSMVCASYMLNKSLTEI